MILCQSDELHPAGTWIIRYRWVGLLQKGVAVLNGVSAKHSVLLRKNLIHANLAIIFSDRQALWKSNLIVGQIRYRKYCQQWRNHRINHHRGDTKQLRALCYSDRRSRRTMAARRQGICNLSDSSRLSQPFISSKDKCFIFFQRGAQRSSRKLLRRKGGMRASPLATLGA